MRVLYLLAFIRSVGSPFPPFSFSHFLFSYIFRRFSEQLLSQVIPNLDCYFLINIEILHLPNASVTKCYTKLLLSKNIIKVSNKIRKRLQKSWFSKYLTLLLLF